VTTIDDRTREAVTDLFRKHGDKVYALGLQVCRNPEDAHDLVQETFLRALKSWPTFQGRSKASTWLYTIAHRACIRLQRRRSGEPTPSQLSALGTQAGEWLSTGEEHSSLDEVLKRESAATVHRVIGGLPDEFRFAVVLKEFAGLTLQEIADILRLKPATVKTRLHRGRLRIARALSDTVPDLEVERPPGQVCLDIIEAKQRALDEGVPYPVPDEEVCTLCHNVCRTLDDVEKACQDLASVGLHPPDAERVATSLGDDP
jgi:RNA polymerase sigma-70 factor (ECF subfamily)